MGSTWLVVIIRPDGRITVEDFIDEATARVAYDAIHEGRGYLAIVRSEYGFQTCVEHGTAWSANCMACIASRGAYDPTARKAGR